MKRISVLLLVLILMAGCTANLPAAGENADAPTVRKPPALTVRAGESEGAAVLSTYSWTWPNGDGTDTGVEADGPHPLDMLDRVTPLSPGNDRTATLTFDLGELALDRLTVRRWDLSCADDPDKYESGYEMLPFTADGDTVTVALPDSRGGVFEVHACFRGESHGDGYYTFCLEGGTDRAAAYTYETLRMVWREGLAERPQALLIRSRAELQDALAGETAQDGALPDRDDSFFRDHELILIRLEEGSGSISHQVTGVLTGPDGVTIAIRRTVPEVCTADMAAWLLLAELPAGTVGDAPVTVKIVG